MRTGGDVLRHLEDTGSLGPDCVHAMLMLLWQERWTGPSVPLLGYAPPGRMDADRPTPPWRLPER